MITVGKSSHSCSVCGMPARCHSQHCACGEFHWPPLCCKGCRCGVYARKHKPHEEAFRTRWRRWLAQKSRPDRNGWVDLLSSDWLGWVDQVYAAHDIEYHRLGLTQDVARIRRVYLAAIDVATLEELNALDSLYATDRWLDE